MAAAAVEGEAYTVPVAGVAVVAAAAAAVQGVLVQGVAAVDQEDVEGHQEPMEEHRSLEGEFLDAGPVVAVAREEAEFRPFQVAPHVEEEHDSALDHPAGRPSEEHCSRCQEEAGHVLDDVEAVDRAVGVRAYAVAVEDEKGVAGDPLHVGKGVQAAAVLAYVAVVPAVDVAAVALEVVDLGQGAVDRRASWSRARVACWPERVAAV